MILFITRVFPDQRYVYIFILSLYLPNVYVLQMCLIIGEHI